MLGCYYHAHPTWSNIWFSQIFSYSYNSNQHFFKKRFYPSILEFKNKRVLQISMINIFFLQVIGNLTEIWETYSISYYYFMMLWGNKYWFLPWFLWLLRGILTVTLQETNIFIIFWVIGVDARRELDSQQMGSVTLPVNRMKLKTLQGKDKARLVVSES